MSSSPISRALRVGIAVAMVCGVAACATGPKRTAEQRQVDREIIERVQSALDGDKLLYAKHIFVNAYNGTVTLSGYVWTAPDMLEAETIAGNVEGVKGVDNKLELQLNGIDDSGVAR